MRWPVVALPFLLLAGLLLPASAQADASLLALLTPKLANGDNADLQWQLVATVAGELEDSGFQVLLPHELNPKLRPEQRACDRVECASELEKLLLVDGIVTVSVAHGSAGDSVEVLLIDATGHTFSGGARVTADVVVNQAALQALRQALTALGRGPGPWLIIRGEPAGASVQLNEKAVGNLPHVQTIAAAGVNRLAISANGYDTARESRTLAGKADEVVEVDVHLKPTGGGTEAKAAPGETTHAAGSEPARVRRSSVWNDVIGWSGVALGALFLIKPIASAASAGDCAQRSATTGNCTRTNEFSSTAVWHTVGGVALAGAGVAVLLVRPITVSASGDREHAMLQLSGSF